MVLFTRVGLALLLGAAVGCSNNGGSPVSPGGITPGSTAAGPGGTTLKAGTPTAVAPSGDAVLDTRTPTLRIGNTRSTYQSAALSYEVELYKVNDLLRSWLVAGATGDTTETAITEELEYDTIYRWRARARVNDAFGLWSAASNFRTPPRPNPTVTPGPTDGSVGPNRVISFNEAFNIIVEYHNASRANLGSGSTRESRVDFFFGAVAIIHYGHPRYNPAGGDPDWCVKDAGGGRPPSDDVLVRCGSRESWDLIGGAGANGYSFHTDYIGRLPSGQNVYPPPRSFLPR
jgi:hypothetical protein